MSRKKTFTKDSSSKQTKPAKMPLVVLLILDGWGVTKVERGNAVALAQPAYFESLKKKYFYTELGAHGRYVGLPPTQEGNSEAGHMNIGAGRVVEQDSVRIAEAINDGSFFRNPALAQIHRHLQKNKSALHLIGLLSGEQSAHVDPDHLLALLTWAKIKKIKKVYLHLFTDGRDSPKYSSLKFLESLLRSLKNDELVGTVIGRFYAMDRKKYWHRTELAYNALVLGEGIIARSPQAAITQVYNQGLSDEFIPPYVIFNRGKIVPRIKDGDAVFFFNLRSDRARQLTKAFVQPDFNTKNPQSFLRRKILKDLLFVGLTNFGPDLDKVVTAFPDGKLTNTLPIMLSGIKQFYGAENEKYAHVTYFFNGGYDQPVNGEKRWVCPSPDVISYDQKPEMSAKEITKKVLTNLKQNKFNFYCINFANPDMVGHTGNLAAGIEAVNCIDQQLKKIVPAVLKKNGTVIITADHGNVEEMINLKTGEVDTEHSINPVPFLLINKKIKKINSKHKISGALCDIAPTVLKLYNINPPKEMKGQPLY
jgi:2,3-bisphosphoglycerate-independent phosphoglycerate mutase